MSKQKTQAPAIEGWFRMEGDEPSLIGTQCTSCQTYFFPRETVFCRNPRCAGAEFDEVPLSRRGKLWSFTDNHYAPPQPYMSPDPFETYAVAAVELEKEQMVVLGQVVGGVGVDQLKAGMEMELVVDTLYEDDDNEYMIWKWRPAA